MQKQKLSQKHKNYLQAGDTFKNTAKLKGNSKQHQNQEARQVKH